MQRRSGRDSRSNPNEFPDRRRRSSRRTTSRDDVQFICEIHEPSVTINSSTIFHTGENINWGQSNHVILDDVSHESLVPDIIFVDHYFDPVTVPHYSPPVIESHTYSYVPVSSPQLEDDGGIYYHHQQYTSNDDSDIYIVEGSTYNQNLSRQRVAEPSRRRLRDRRRNTSHFLERYVHHIRPVFGFHNPTDRSSILSILTERLMAFNSGFVDNPINEHRPPPPSPESLLKSQKCYRIKTKIHVEKIKTESCVVCYDSYKQGQYILELYPCGHSFHRGCITKWLRRNGTCPLCRKVVTHPPDAEI